jgi:hypothetical protein
MKYVFQLVCLLALGLPALHAQVRITYGTEDEAGCRMTRDELRAVITPRNPFFVNHHWDEATKTEIAQLGPERFLTLSQEACKRHHIKLALTVNREAAQPDDPNFYPREVFQLMNRVFHQQISYYTYKLEFEDELLKAFAVAGVRQRFNFHVNDRNFFCYFDGGEWGAKLEIEIIRLVHKEKIKLPGIAAYLDDGHKQVTE